MTAFRSGPVNPTHDHATRSERGVTPSANAAIHELTEVGPKRPKRQKKKAEPRKRSRCCLSWIYDGDGIEHGWKPFSLTAPVLACLAVLSLLIAAAIETLAQRSSANGGLALAPTLDDIPQWPLFASKYVPNIAAALYSLVWNWVDLDVKRMQPWFQLSRPGGARGEDSLFLDYPCEFIAFVPWTAAKKRHWPVFLSGTAVMIVFWAITPFQSAIFGTGAVQRLEKVNIANRSELLPVSQQGTLDSRFLNTAYAIGWLGQEYPPFMTANYALLPYYVDEDPAPKRSEANWTATTTKLSTELSCWPATISKKVPGVDQFYFLNGQGCNATIIVQTSSMLYIGYYSSPYSDFALGDWDCPKTPNSVHQFLAIWRASDAGEPNITAVYCQSHYYKQDVTVAVSADSLKPHNESISSVAERETLGESEFNSTVFEYVVANSMPIGAESTIKDRPYSHSIEPGPRLSKYGFKTAASSMVGFALAGQNLSIDAYGNPQILGEAFNRAHKYLFSVAVSQLLVNRTSFSNHTASSAYPMQGILVSRVFSAVVESLLAVSIVLTIVLLWLCRNAACHLRENPNSISRLIDIYRNSPEILDTFRKLDNADDKSLLKRFRNDVFRLSRVEGTDERRLQIEKVTETSSNSTDHPTDASEAYYTPIRPFPLTRKMGLIFLAILLSAIAVIAWLKAKEVALEGLPRPSTSFEVLQLLENYLPTAFASLVEPFWVLLNRLLCVMQPFRDLWAGKARPIRSIDTTYSAIPPQLTMWRALKARHFVLALVCITTLAANLLGIGLGALFNEADTRAKYGQEFKPKLAARFSNESVARFINATSTAFGTGEYQDHVYVAMANISNGTPLPPWVAPEYFFLPHSVVASDGNPPADTYTLHTRGFGASLNCTPIAARLVPPPPVQTQAADPKSGLSICPDALTLIDDAFRQKLPLVNKDSKGPYAIEFGNPISQDPEQLCENTYALGWGRAPENGTGLIKASYATCQPIFETAMFEVVIDAVGNIISHQRTSAIESSLDFLQSTALETKILFTANRLLSKWPVTDWHNDTLTRDWLSHLMMLTIHVGPRDFLDPKKPVPDPKNLISYAGDIYRRTFAILLGLNQDPLFEPIVTANESSSVTGTRFATETRIFLDHTALVITLVVLSIDAAITVLFYTRAAVFVLPRMPTNIGSILAYVAPSRVIGSSGNCLGRHNRTFSFGRYLGSDGSVHIGIEMDPHVVPIDPSSVRETKTVLRRMRRKKSGLQSGHWL